MNIVVSGYCGRMGSRIAYLGSLDKDIKLLGGVERKGHSNLGKDLGQLIGVGELKIPLTDDLASCVEKGCVVIEFTSPETTISHLDILKENKINAVIGTTGLSSNDIDKIRYASVDIGIVVSANMSIGVNLLFDFVEYLTKKAPFNSNIEIVETHHKFKKDAPSGTAKKIADIISKARGKNLDDIAVYGREGDVGERSDDEIAIHSVRTSDVVGEHTIIFGLDQERLELTHKAHSRDVFVLGALRVAKFISNKQNGLYNMKDVLEKG